MPSKTKFSPIILYTIFLCLFLDIIIISDFPILRQVFGFMILILFPGFLIISIFSIKSDYLEKFLLSWGVSVSFIMIFGLFLNNTLLYFGFKKPLSTISLLIAFNAIFIILSIFVSIFGKKDFLNPLLLKKIFGTLRLNTAEKAFLIIPSLFPALGIYGIHLMNKTNNNSFLFVLLFLIPIYIIFICLNNQKFSNRLYPIVIYLISISIIILLPLRSNHLIGIDTHKEYYIFQTVLNSSYWNVFYNSTLDSTLSISLLPAILQLLLNISPEFLFRILYPIIYSISPLIVYVISKRYVEELYAFLTSCFFMFQWIFIWTEYNARTSLAVLFFAFSIFVLFNENINSSIKKLLLILFTVSCVFSHYATTYIFFIITFSVLLLNMLLSTKYPIKKLISPAYVILFFGLIFLWYSLVTDRAFYSGVNFAKHVLINLTDFFSEDARSSPALSVLGKNIGLKAFPHKIEFLFTWACFSLIGIGISNLVINYKKMSFSEIYMERYSFLKKKFDVTYSIVAILFAFMLLIMVSFPFISNNYGMERLYGLSITVLSLFFTIGAMFLSKCFKIRPYFIVLLVIIPYFLSVTGITYNIFDIHRSIILNSDGEQYDIYYIYDQESVSAKWLKKYITEHNVVYTSSKGKIVMESQAGYPYKLISDYNLLNNNTINGVGFLDYNTIKYNILGNCYENTSNLVIFNSSVKSNFIYNNGRAGVQIFN